MTQQKSKVDVKVLESALKDAIEKEEYEKAAQLRNKKVKIIKKEDFRPLFFSTDLLN